MVIWILIILEEDRENLVENDEQNEVVTHRQPQPVVSSNIRDEFGALELKF